MPTHMKTANGLLGCVGEIFSKNLLGKIFTGFLNGNSAGQWKRQNEKCVFFSLLENKRRGMKILDNNRSKCILCIHLC